jgi:sugar (pentulose or hexulose) kinase
MKIFDVKALNYSAYGASFVHIDKNGDPVTPLYSYLKPYPDELKEKFYHIYGDETKISVATASPVLGNLNAGMQLYRLKCMQNTLFERIRYSLHLPQYLSYLATGKAYSDITSIGCHTGLWNFEKKDYHDWVYAEKIDEKLAPLFPSNETVELRIHGKRIRAGIGLHDSSVALIPYLASFSESFVLISTGTWCISLNPFNNEPLTAAELKEDCVCYIGYNGRPVKASRLFAGNEHEQQVKILSEHFHVDADHYKTIVFAAAFINKNITDTEVAVAGLHASHFSKRNLDNFSTYAEAYHTLLYDIIQQQKFSTALVQGNQKTTHIFVDGGFAKNPVYMNLLAAAFPGMKVFAASVSQATALGAALAIHPCWNSKPVPKDMIGLEYYSITR